MKKRFLPVLLALVLFAALAVPAFSANAASPLTTDFSNLTIYDVDDGQYALRDTGADISVLIIGRVNCGYTTSTLRNVLDTFNTLKISNGRVYLLDVDRSESTVRSYARQLPAGAHYAWSNGQSTYNSLFWEIVHALEPGVNSTSLPAVCALDRNLQPVFYASHNTYKASNLTNILIPYAGGPVPSTMSPDPTPAPAPTPAPTQGNSSQDNEIYRAMTALKAQYPEGMPWTNANYYGWKGGIFSGGYGCAGFAFMLSDAAFGSLPARRVTGFAFSDVKVGDILRVDNDTHSVIVLEVHNDYVVIAEGNYNSSVHWGRKLSANEVLRANYLLTRYPANGSNPTATPAPTPTPTPTPTPAPTPTPTPTPTPAPTPTPTPTPTPAPTPAPTPSPTPEPTPAPAPSPAPAVAFTDVPASQYYAKSVKWAVENGITNGTTTTTFSPGRTCTEVEILTFLWRAADSPASSTPCPVNLPSSLSYAEDALRWAAEKGMIDRTFSTVSTCTRGTAVRYIWQALDSPRYGSSSFNDVPSNSIYASAVNWAVDAGVTNGYPGNDFRPYTTCSRAQIVTFLYRAYVPGAGLS